MSKSALLVAISLVISNTAVSQSKEIVASFGSTLPPYVMEDGPSGILIDLLKDCLEPSGYKVTPKLHPYARRLVEFETNSVDVVTDVNEKVINDKKLDGYYTGYVYAYENFLFSLADRKFEVKTIEELSEYSLLSWQGAIAHIGGEYADMAKQNKNYSETYNQKNQLRMLFSRRVDFVQMDGNIYEYYRQQMLNESGLDVTVPVNILPLFGKSPNGFMFKTEAVRDACVANLENVKKNKKYKNVLYFDAE
jgi:polar amino acid transport system substrate-binding protein